MCIRDSRKAAFLAKGEVCKATFWRIPGMKERAFDSPGFSAEETLISASAISHLNAHTHTNKQKHIGRAHVGPVVQFKARLT